MEEGKEVGMANVSTATISPLRGVAHCVGRKASED